MSKETRLRLPTFYKKYSKQLKNFTEQEFKAKIKPSSGDTYRLLVCSDRHQWFRDEAAQDCLLKIIENNHFDEICDNGDGLDLPYLSGHTSKLKRINDKTDLLRDYSEIKEIELEKRFFKDLRDRTSAKIRRRNGNHDERITKPRKYNKQQLERLNELFLAYQTSRIDKMLQLAENGVIYDDSPYFTYFNCFTVVHGLSLAQNASDKNLQSYWGSGTSGHTHRLDVKYYTKLNRTLVWAQSGCLRLLDEVEYMPTGVVTNWQHGFIEVNFYKIETNKYLYFVNPYPIHKGKCVYNGVLY